MFLLSASSYPLFVWLMSAGVAAMNQQSKPGKQEHPSATRPHSEASDRRQLPNIRHGSAPSSTTGPPTAHITQKPTVESVQALARPSTVAQVQGQQRSPLAMQLKKQGQVKPSPALRPGKAPTTQATQATTEPTDDFLEKWLAGKDERTIGMKRKLVQKEVPSLTTAMRVSREGTSHQPSSTMGVGGPGIREQDKGKEKAVEAAAERGTGSGESRGNTILRISNDGTPLRQATAPGASSQGSGRQDKGKGKAVEVEAAEEQREVGSSRGNTSLRISSDGTPLRQATTPGVSSQGSGRQDKGKGKAVEVEAAEEQREVGSSRGNTSLRISSDGTPLRQATTPGVSSQGSGKQDSTQASQPSTVRRGRGRPKGSKTTIPDVRPRQVAGMTVEAPTLGLRKPLETLSRNYIRLVEKRHKLGRDLKNPLDRSTRFIPLHQLAQGVHATEADYEARYKELNEALRFAQTPEEIQRISKVLATRRSRKKKESLGLGTKARVPNEYKGLSLEETNARLRAERRAKARRVPPRSAPGAQGEQATKGTTSAEGGILQSSPSGRSASLGTRQEGRGVKRQRSQGEASSSTRASSSRNPPPPPSQHRSSSSRGGTSV